MPEHASELQVVSRRRDRRRYDENGKRALVETALRSGMYELLKNKGAPRPRLCVLLIVR